MEAVRNIVRSIALVILLASFLEMLLPNSSMRRFVQLVMGLFVLMAVLGPVAAFLKSPLAFEIPALSQEQRNSQELVEVFEQGNRIREQSKQAALDEYKTMVERQVKALALTVKGVSQVSVKINAKESGEIDELNLTVGDGKSEISPVKPIDEDPTGKPVGSTSPEQKRISRELQTRLGALIGVPEEKITVKFAVETK